MGSCNVLDRFSVALGTPAARGSAVDVLRQRARSIDLAAGDVARLGRTRDHLVFVATGATKLVAETPPGSDQIVSFQFPGDFVSVPAGAPHAFSLHALHPSELLAFARNELIEAGKADPDLLAALLGRTIDILQDCGESAVLLGRKSAAERVAGFIASLVSRLAPKDESKPLIHLPMSRRDMGESIGLTVETISRQITQLRDCGLIETPGRALIRVLDREALAARAGQFASAG